MDSRGERANKEMRKELTERKIEGIESVHEEDEWMNGDDTEETQTHGERTRKNEREEDV